SCFCVAVARRRGPAACFVMYDLGFTALHDGNAGVGGAEVNSDNLGHNWLLSLLISALDSTAHACALKYYENCVRCCHCFRCGREGAGCGSMQSPKMNA